MEDRTDEWGVTYSADGRVLEHIDPELCTCEEYTIPEGVVEIRAKLKVAILWPRKQNII